MEFQPLRGLVAATHTPFHTDGSLNLQAIESQAKYLQHNGIRSVFIGGSTGESHSLSLQERLDLTARWAQVTAQSEMDVIVHVGSNSLRDASELARQAQVLGARAISMVTPSYFKPRSLDALVACCAEVARAAPEVPFYYYDIPALTGVKFPMPDFIERAASAIATFAGLKFTNFDLGEFQLCREASDGAYQVLWGVDEFYLAALALGAPGAIGSTFNFAAPLAQRLEASFARGDWESARREQIRIVQVVQVLAGYGYLPAAKALMAMLGVNVGPARLPNETLTPERQRELRGELEKLGFFDWLEH